MPVTASPSWEAWSDWSTPLPADLNLDTLALTNKAIQRRREVGVFDGETQQRLCLARGQGGKRLPGTAARAPLNGIAELTGSSLNEPLHRSGGFLAAITYRLLAGRPGVRPRPSNPPIP